MSITIKRYKNLHEFEWDNFVSNSNNGTLLHYRKFLNYHQDRSFEDYSLMFYLKNKLCCILPAAKIKKNREIIFHSHPGASFGGFIYVYVNSVSADNV